MKPSSKYSLNGVYKCENFAQHVENDDFPEIPIGSAFGLSGWYIEFRVSNKDDGTWVYPFICHHNHPKVQVRAYFKILKKDGSSSFKTKSKNIYLKPNEGPTGMHMNIEQLLDEKKGYLDNGALSIEYRFQVVSVEGEDGIWKFNLRDKFFEWQTKKHMFELIIRQGSSVFCHRQIIKLHLNIIVANKNSEREPISSRYDALHMCVQIMHGVRLQMDVMEYRNVATVAFYLGFCNTVKYCEQKLIELEESTELEFDHFQFAVDHDMRHYLVHLLKHIKTKKQLVKILRRLNLEKMPSETMKAIVAKIFSF